MQSVRVRPHFLDLSDLEEFSGISRRTWQKWIGQGQIAAYQPGAKILLDRDEVIEFIRESRMKSRTEQNHVRQARSGEVK